MKIIVSLLMAGALAVTTSVSAADSLPIGSDLKVRQYAASLVEEVLVNVWYVTNTNYRVIFDFPLFSYNTNTNGLLEPFMKSVLGQRCQTTLTYANTNTLFGANVNAYVARYPYGLFVGTTNSHSFYLETNGSGGFRVPNTATNIDILMTREIPYEVADLKWAKIIERDQAGNVVNEIDSRTNSSVHFLSVDKTLGQNTTNLLYMPRDKIIAGTLGEVVITSGNPERQKKYRLDNGARIYTNAFLSMTMSNQAPVVSLVGEALERVSVEYSTNLASGWMTITNLTLSADGTASYTCQPFTTHPQRFYRLRYE